MRINAFDTCTCTFAVYFVKAMVRIFILVFMLQCFAACKPALNPQDKKVVDRINLIFDLKKNINSDYWPDFTNTNFDVPLLYYTDTGTYVANPTGKFLQQFHCDLLSETSSLKIYKVAKRIDSLPFHMATGMTLGDSTDDYHFRSPFMQCSSFEETKKIVSQINCTEEWITMIIHEYFHGFQYKHAGYMKYYEDEIVQLQPDSLLGFYKQNEWYKKSIDAENEFLLKALAHDNKDSIHFSINRFFMTRSERRARFKKQFGYDITKYEQCYETMEGTARYIEFSLYKVFGTSTFQKIKMASDSSFKSGLEFKDYSITKDEWLYKSNKTTYSYALGFNTARLLDKLKIEYKTRLFNEPNLSLEALLPSKILFQK
jgi:hypothetical protein